MYSWDLIFFSVLYIICVLVKKINGSVKLLTNMAFFIFFIVCKRCEFFFQTVFFKYYLIRILPFEYKCLIARVCILIRSSQLNFKYVKFLTLKTNKIEITIVNEPEALMIFGTRIPKIRRKITLFVKIYEVFTNSIRKFLKINKFFENCYEIKLVEYEIETSFFFYLTRFGEVIRFLLTFLQNILVRNETSCYCII